MKTAGPTPNNFYAEDKLAGLYFLTFGRVCRFRAECGFEFNHPLEATASYALIDPQTGDCVGIAHRGAVIHPGQEGPTPFRVYLLRPQLPNPALERLSVDELQKIIAEHIHLL